MPNYIPPLNYRFLTRFYDPFVSLLGFTTSERKRILGMLDLKPGENVLDVGCGTGTLALLASQYFPIKEVTGVDPDVESIAIARDKAHKEKIAVEFVSLENQKLPFKDNHFDAIVSTLAFHHMSTQVKKETISEIKRVLKDKGRFLLVDFGLASSWYVKLLFRLEVMFGIEEAETLRDNLEGKVPIYLKERGFLVETASSKRFGLEYLIAVKKAT